MKLIISIIGLFLSVSIYGQKEADLFNQLLDSTGAYFAEPLETFFKSQKVKKNELIAFDFALKGIQDPVDIYYKVIPFGSDDRRNIAPFVTMNTMAIQAASNDEEKSDMVFHQIDESDLKPFNADFGISVFFQPKEKISHRNHCNATFLFASEKGILCTFIFFDRVDIDLRPYQQNLIFASGNL